MSQKLGDLIRNGRREQGLSQKDLARKIGVSHTFISHIEAGRREPTLPKLRLLQKHLRLSSLALAMVLFNQPQDQEGEKSE